MTKHLFAFILALIFTNSLFGQNLTLDEFANLREKTFVGVEEYLTNKKWEILSIEQGEGTALDVVTFAYNKSSYSDKAESFIKYYYSDLSKRKRVNIQINTLNKYNTYLSALKAKGCKLVDTKIENSSITKVYQNKLLTFMVSTYVSKNDLGNTSTNYAISLLDNDDYQLNFKD